ncbi:MAG TPA: hypothetical protein V6D19_15745 [Stenomitos sp.]
MSEIEQLEQELAELRRRFAQALSVVEDLSQVKAYFSDLSQKHQALETSLEKAKVFLENPPEPSLEPRLAQLESQVDVRYEQLQAQLTNFRFDFDAVTRQLKEQIDRDQAKLHELNKGHPVSENSEDGDRLKWLESSLQHLNSSIYADRSMLQKLERRYNNLKRLVDIIAVVGVTGFILIVVLIFMVMKV